MLKLTIEQLKREMEKDSFKNITCELAQDYKQPQGKGFFVGTTMMECDGCGGEETFYLYNLDNANTNDLLGLIEECDFEVVKVVKEDLPNIIFNEEKLKNAQDEIGEDVPYGIYMLKDCQGAIYGGIEYEFFVHYENTQEDFEKVLYGLIDRLHMYWNNYHIDFVD